LHRFSLLLGVLALVGVAREARAYCRSRTCEFPQKGVPCEYDEATGCSTVGEFVFWRDRCLSFAVDRKGSVAQGIAAEDVEQLVASGFEAWSDASCSSGSSPELAAGSQGTIACGKAEYDCTVREANSNLVMFRDDFVDTVYGLRVGVIAVTTLTANLNTGELFDADIEINSRDEDFALGAPAGVGVGDRRDLRGVINHELGHLLGLSHSAEPGALMRTHYEGTILPGADDSEGICAALGSASDDPVCEVPGLPPDAGCVGSDTSCKSHPAAEGEDGCACQVGAPAKPSLLGWGAAFVFVALARRRRRARKTLSSGFRCEASDCSSSPARRPAASRRDELGHDGKHLLGLKGLDHPGLDASGSRLVEFGRLGLRRQHDDRCELVGGDLLHHLDEGQAVYHRHVDVADDQVDILPLELGKPVLTVTRLEHLVTGTVQHRAQDVPHGGGVIDDQQSLHHVSSFP
jgi:MYXO-CTERM domain-containing protein